jgi:flagellar protein FliS
MSAAYTAALREYRESGIAAQLTDASPHRLIAMLYDGALERLALAQSGITFRNIPAKLKGIDATMAILDHLHSIVDVKAGGKIAQNLIALYDYMMRRLIHAKINNDVEAVKEVASLLRTVKSGWDAIAPQVG